MLIGAPSGRADVQGDEHARVCDMLNWTDCNKKCTGTDAKEVHTLNRKQYRGNVHMRFSAKLGVLVEPTWWSCQRESCQRRHFDVKSMR